MPKFSREKGRRGEIGARDLLRCLGFQDVGRTAQRTGKSGMPDLEGIPGLHIEVKVGAAPAIGRAMEQAEGDSKAYNIPVVLSKKDRGKWLCTIRAVDMRLFGRIVGTGESGFAIMHGQPRGCGRETG